ncbi:unnamed protein product [Adineta steineri]|uniref:G-protein coupled receptors family 1 profile domain-containing protein n=1 Tax=Adineta steineri TaxID=433720 RepID=A0A818TLS7_9BILA|nr:unnamed protein product [Adineta steineri]CAF3686351.1 unnamed protein product [Adineta steineri]
MNNATIDEVTFIAHKLIITMGIIMYVFGLIGNALNICVFTIWCRSHKQGNENNGNNRPSNSSLYLLTSSYANFILIIYPLLTRIVYDGFQYPKTPNNVIFTCKLRYYVLHTSDLISLTCICMATLDRYLISSRQARLRQLSTTPYRTKQIILLIIFIIGLHNISVGYYYEISDFDDCIISSERYLYYYLCIIQIFFHAVFPICFLSVFGTLTYKQLKLSSRTTIQLNFHMDKQLSRMLLLLCISILISSIPYCMGYTYLIAFNYINTKLLSYNLIIYFIAAVSFFANAVSSFYIFFISTPNFRRQVKKILQCNSIFFEKNNQINVITITPTV